MKHEAVAMRSFISVKTGFSAAHRLFNPEWSFERNQEVYGICNNPHGHGHNYTLEVTVEGAIPPETGMILDMKELKELIEDAVISKVDHKHLNHDVDFLQGVIPTAENLATVFWGILEPGIGEGKLYEVRVYESSKNIAFVRR